LFDKGGKNMSEAQGKMEIEKRQMSERNKLARYCGTIAAIAIAFFAICNGRYEIPRPGIKAHVYLNNIDYFGLN